MNKSPQSTNQKRVSALMRYQVMDTAPQSEFDELTHLASQVCQTPMAAMTLLDDRRQWFKSRFGFQLSETAIEHAFCAHAIQRPDDVMVVRDAARDLRFRGNPFVISGPLVRFYAGAPLITPEGIAIGAICTIDQKSRNLTPGQKAALRTISNQAMALLELRRASFERRVKSDETASEQRRLNALLDASARQRLTLERSEAYFRHLSEFALDLITILDVDGTIRFESRSIETELGHTPEHYRGRNAFEFVHPDDCSIVMQAFANALKNQGNTPAIRFRFKHADGTYRILEGKGNNLLDDPAVRGIVFNSRDITDTVKLQEAVDHARAEKEDTIARLTGGVAHDFNNILTTIQGFAELAQGRLEGRPEAEFLHAIREATGRAAALTQHLLAFSRKVVLQPRALALGPWLKSIEPRLQALLGTSIDLSIAVHGELSVWQDPAQLEQVVLQLATNARDAMGASGGFSLEALPIILGPCERPVDGRDGDLNSVELTVSDHGSGMDDTTLARIFDPFFSTKADRDHSGLGLAMCRGTIEQSGGHITVQSRVGQGTVFRLYLPATDLIAEEPPLVPRPVASPGIPTVLLVDDEPTLREIGETILSEAGYRVLVAEDGTDALARLSELGDNSLDLLLTDVVMPGMNGVQLAAEVSRQRPGTRVLLCSGYTRDALAGSCGGLPPGVAFIPKPYTLANLLDKVAEVLDGVTS